MEKSEILLFQKDIGNNTKLRSGMDVGMLPVKQKLQPQGQRYKISACAGTFVQQIVQMISHNIHLRIRMDHLQENNTDKRKPVFC